MRMAVISDIHGNLEALEAVLSYIDNNHIESVFCLGDIVGYGPNPNETVALIAERCAHVVIGNHDHAALGLTSTEYFNDFAKISTHWTSNNLSDENKNYLHALDFTYSADNLLAVHATPSAPQMWHYILSEVDAQHEFKFFDERICFIGHSHFPIIFNDRAGFTRAPRVKLESGNKFIVNVGSVGQPRDGNPRACFCVYNKDEDLIEFVRLDYDLEKTREKIIRAGLPVFLADRLKKGY